MRQLFILTIITLFSLSCESDEIIINEKCALTNGNEIKNLNPDGRVSLDSLTINLKNTDYKLQTRSASVTQQFYNYKLNRRTVEFGNGNGELSCFITIYYPGDSSYFNNQDFLTVFMIKDSDTPFDPLL